MAEDINHPIRYNADDSGVECIDVVERLPFNLGSALKYIWRRDHKQSFARDLQKAAWYLRREAERIAREEEQQTTGGLISDVVHGSRDDLLKLALLIVESSIEGANTTRLLDLAEKLEGIAAQDVQEGPEAAG